MLENINCTTDDMRHMHKILLSELQRTLFEQQRTEEDSEPDEAEQFERQLHIDEMNRYERQLQNAIQKKEELRLAKEAEKAQIAAAKEASLIDGEDREVSAAKRVRIAASFVDMALVSAN